MMPKKSRFSVFGALPSKERKTQKPTSTTYDFISDDSTSDEFDEFEPPNPIGTSTNEWDPFCWKCHKDSHGQVRCSKCVLSFHTGCVTDWDRDRADWLCPECQAETDYAQGSSTDNDLIKCLVERVLRYTTLDVSMDGFNVSVLVNPVMFLNIVEKAKQSQYVSLEALLLDFKWLLHNCNILCNQKRGSDKNKKKAEQLLKACKDEMFELEKCTDCYINQFRSNAFTMVCSKPHLLVWAQYTGHPYWPAKVMMSKKKQGPKSLLVHFFGDHTSASISYKDAFLYSKEDPNIWFTDFRDPEFTTAVREAQEHIDNIEKKFGPFQFQPLKTRVKRDNIDMEHLEMMIPGLRNPALRPNHNNHGTVYHNENVVDENFVDEIPDVPDQHLNSENDESIYVQNVSDGVSSSISHAFSSNMMSYLPELPFSEIMEVSNRVNIPHTVMDKLRACNEYMKGLTEEREKYTKQNSNLRQRIVALENELKEKDKALKQRDRFNPY